MSKFAQFMKSNKTEKKNQMGVPSPHCEGE